MENENFIYFSTVSGFFIGIIYSILKNFEFSDFLFTTFLLTAVFYLISIAGMAFFVKYLDIKKFQFFNKNTIDEVLNIQIKELEKNENFIYENYQFIKQIDKEETAFIRKKINAA